jgi:hypothetical protein
MDVAGNLVRSVTRRQNSHTRVTNGAIESDVRLVKLLGGQRTVAHARASLSGYLNLMSRISNFKAEMARLRST